jgi:16S rRNA G966 N2-methylase RsmD
VLSTPSRKRGSDRRPGPQPSRRLVITYRPIGELRLDERNPRAHSKRQIRQLADSIEEFGFIGAVVIDGQGNIIAGNARVLACLQLGWTEVPTIGVDHLSPEQIRAYIIADNRLAETATWDERLLAETLRDLSLADLDFSLEVTGFEMAEIDLRIESLTAPTKGEDDAADVEVPAPVGPAVSRPGDLWILGRHRLLCGSALDAAVYARLMAGKRAAMVFTDPPYNVPIAGHVGGLGAIRHREFPMASGEMSSPDFTAFLSTALGRAAEHSRDGALHFVCMDWRHMRELLAAGAEAYTELKNLCVWAKDNAGMGSLYRSQHELVFVYKSGKGAHLNNVELGRHGRHRTNLWSYPGINTLRRSSDEGDLLALHPTVKPVRLVADAILDCTARGDLVLDPFLGSGTTLIAAERVGRRCAGIELDPLYIDTIIRRWQALTGDMARHGVSGESFEAAERHAAASAVTKAEELADVA